MEGWARTLCFILTLILLAASTSSEDQKNLPSYIETCFRDDPKVADCIKRNIEKLAPMFKSGSKELDLVPLNPIQYKQIVFDYRSSIIGGKLTLPNLALAGLTDNIKVLDVRPKLNNPNKLLVDFDVHIPILNIKTDFNMNGNVISIPVNVGGRINADLEDVNMTFHIAGHTKKFGDSNRLVLDNFTWKFFGEGIRHARLNNQDLVDGFPALNRVASSVLVNQWRQIRDNIMPSVLRERQLMFTDIFSNFFKKYPYDVLFPRRTKSAPEPIRSDDTYQPPILEPTVIFPLHMYVPQFLPPVPHYIVH